MAEVVYFLNAITGLICAVLLWRANRRNPSRLLLFSSICFAALTVNSILLVLDRVIWPEEVDLRLARIGVAAIGLIIMLWGLITQED